MYTILGLRAVVPLASREGIERLRAGWVIGRSFSDKHSRDLQVGARKLRHLCT